MRTSMLTFRDPGTPLTPEQAELRRLVLKQVEADPAAFSMRDWESVQFRDFSGCGTTRCLEGWAEFFAYGEVDGIQSNSIHSATGVSLLGLTKDEYFGDGVPSGDRRLFFVGDAEALRRMREITPAS